MSIYKGEMETDKGEILYPHTSADIVTLDSTKLKSKDVKTALEELFTFADNGKKNWVDVIGSPLSKEDSFSTLKSKTQNLKNTFASNLNDKKVNASGTEGLSNLINKIKNIDTGKKFITGKIYVSEIFAECSSNGESINKQHFTKQLRCPFEIGLFAIDLHYFGINNTNRLFLYIKDGFVTEFTSYTKSGFSKSNGSHIDTRYTTILDSTVNLDWYIIYMYKNDIRYSYLNWIAIEK